MKLLSGELVFVIPQELLEGFNISPRFQNYNSLVGIAELVANNFFELQIALVVEFTFLALWGVIQEPSQASVAQMYGTGINGRINEAEALRPSLTSMMYSKYLFAGSTPQ